jgi:hypothetical protein
MNAELYVMDKYNRLKRIGAIMEDICIYILHLDINFEIEMKHLNKLYPRSLYHPIVEGIYINTRIIKDHEFKMNVIGCNCYQADFDDDNIVLWKIDEIEDKLNYMDKIEDKLNYMDELD